ncbi:MAG TPA: ATP synthase F1 subunit gamma [Phycisphaerales bacterium]|nr:ATP synthase F1 subunit gamma [Phycisphaerales bacterium]HIO52292.1 ATP synthase F1 subunit gamma [Phycisphaerales bacterium]
MAQIRAIRKRMTAVGTIARITKTMQMIATAKFTAALTRAKDSRPYTDAIRNLVGEVSSAAGDYDSPLFSAPQSTGKELVLVITSDRGLCGAYNGNVLRKALQHTRAAKQNNSEVTLETAGKKATTFFKFQKLDARNQLTFGDKPGYEDVARVANRYMDEFSKGEWDKVSVVYMRFESNARQIPEVIQLLPIAADSNEAVDESSTVNYEFSPSAEEILDDLIPRSVITTLFQMFNDAVVSENIMRMIAMKAATENANDLAKDLKRDYNRARQAQITTELTEIISGAAALE